jgi:putative transposase
MTDSNVITLNKPEQNDPLQEVLREGARKMLAAAIETEIAIFIEQHSALQTEEGKAVVVRNGYLPQRPIQTGLGDIEVKVPKVRDRSGMGIKFNSSLVPPYLKRTQNIEEFLPWLYLRGISTGDFSETLKHLLGPEAPGLSAATISRLKQDWEQDYQDWTRRDLSKKRYVYVWADGIYSNVRQDDRLCLLVIIGSDESGRKELLALTDGYRESAASWEDLLTDLMQRGLKIAPKLATGDGALGFWKAVAKIWPETDQQRCWVHKTANVLEKLPKAVQPKSVF